MCCHILHKRRDEGMFCITKQMTLPLISCPYQQHIYIHTIIKIRIHHCSLQQLPTLTTISQTSTTSLLPHSLSSSIPPSSGNASPGAARSHLHILGVAPSIHCSLHRRQHLPTFSRRRRRYSSSPLPWRRRNTSASASLRGEHITPSPDTPRASNECVERNERRRTYYTYRDTVQRYGRKKK